MRDIDNGDTLIAQRIAAALPGLLGPVGVDFIETAQGLIRQMGIANYIQLRSKAAGE